MINFRYHVVSIIGIFIALAVGVVLGAGPLQSRIQSGMSTSSSSVGADPQLSAQADAEAAGLKALASSTLSGSLAGAKIALVVAPGASDDDVSALRSTLTDAGASVVGRVTLSDNWQSTSMSQYRTTLSTTLASHLTSGAAKTASADGVVGYSIAQVLTSTGSETDLLRQILTDESTPIMTIDEDPSGSATTIVAVGPRAQASASSGSTPTAVTASTDAWVGLAQAVGSTSGVLVGDASTRDAMVSQVRASGTAVTTVDSVGTTLAAVDAALALATPSPNARAYGVGTGAQSVIPPTK
ncbi:copper transporter [Schaalia odontolytica]